jgi:PAS domain S-box-containing protein
MDEDGTREKLPEKPAQAGDAGTRREGVPGSQGEANGPSGLQDRYYHLLIDSTLDMLTILDVEGRIVFNSPALTSVLGYECGELNGRSAFELVHPEDHEALIEFFNDRVPVAGATECIKHRFMHKDGTWHFLESIANNLIDDPEVGHIVVTSHDVTERHRMEEELKRREEYFRAVVENTVDLILIIDESVQIKYANRASLSLLGYDPDELLGTNGLALIHPEEKEWAKDVVETAVRDEAFSPLLELRIRHKNGSWRHMEGTGKNFLAHPAVRGIVLSFRDITDRRRAEEDLKDSEELYKTLVMISPDAVTISDLQGRITYVSPQTLALHDYQDESEIIGKGAQIFIDPTDHEKARGIWERTLREGSVRDVEFRAVRKGGEGFVAELNAALIRDARGEPKNIVAFTREITDRKAMEKELRDRNEELEAFAHTISHDLLTPVAIVEGYAKAALEADAEGRTEAERECLEAIARGAQRMSDLINSLLQYAQAGHMDLESHGVDPEEILMEVLMDLEDDLISRGVQVCMEGELPDVKADAVKLRQVFANLIANAVKHMGDTPEPRVEVGAGVQGGEATFYVRDNGIGIPSELQHKIFEPFRHFSLSGSPGLGIGLSTVKRAVAAWGGRVWVESRPGAGAAFFFTAQLIE